MRRVKGALSVFNQTLKSMLRAYSTELERDWEEGLPWLLLAVKEVSQESTGFSPNDLVFGHTVWSPCCIKRRIGRWLSLPKMFCHMLAVSDTGCM